MAQYIAASLLDSATLAIWLVIVGAVWYLILRPNCRRVLSILAEFRAPIIVVVLAFLIYRTPQLREVLWIEYVVGRGSGSGTFWDVLALAGAMISTGDMSRISILILTVAIGVWTPGTHYDYRRGDAALMALMRGDGQKFITVLFDNRHFKLAWSIALLLPTAIFSNALVASFPSLPSWAGFLYSLGFYGVLFIVILLVAFLIGRANHLAFLNLRGLLRPIAALFLLIAVVCVIFVLAPIFAIAADINIADFGNDIVVVNLFLAASLSLFSFLLWCSSGRPAATDAAQVSRTQRARGGKPSNVTKVIRAGGWFATVLWALRAAKPLAAGWPVIRLLILLVFVLAAFDANDNHRIRTLAAPSSASAATSPAVADSLETAFGKWLASRSKPGGGVYPVYIVAAEGGGIYAAYHAAMFLSAVQDLHPDFARHLFAISAVSGGSLGAATFVSLVAHGDDNASAAATTAANPTAQNDAAGKKHWYVDHARGVLKRDFLSSVLASALFQDAPARWMPCISWFCPGFRLSRARALEHSFESAWSAEFPSGANPFSAGIHALWNPDKDAPALLLNTTEVETGERVVVAPWSLENSGTPGLYSLEDRSHGLEVALSTGVGLSARFPFLTPAGWFTDNSGEKRRLVDGGYADNSGIATALDLVGRLEKMPTQGVKFIIIALVSDPDTPVVSSSHFFGELASPLRALDSTRSARGRLAVDQAEILLNGSRCIEESGEGCISSGALREATLATGDVRVPLGWVLSRHSREAIECSVGLSDHCSTGTSEMEQRAARARTRNRQLIDQIGTDLGR